MRPTRATASHDRPVAVSTRSLRDWPAVTAGVPLMVNVASRPVVVIGGGPVAAAKTEPLLDAGADVTVVAPDAVDEIRDAAESGRLSWQDRAYAEWDLRGALLAVAATGDADVDDRVVRDADAQSTLCVRAGTPRPGGRAGSAAFLAAVRRGDLTLAVSTNGRAPALARRMRAELEGAYGPEYGDLVTLLGDVREEPRIRAGLGALDDENRRAAWRALPLADILRVLRTGDFQTARELALACLSSSSD